MGMVIQITLIKAQLLRTNMASFCKVLYLTIVLASTASAAPQNIVHLRALPLGAVPHLAHPADHFVVNNPQPIAAVRAVAAPAAAVVETETVDIDPSYSFGYSVADSKSGDAKTREEHSEGGVVTGSYTVAQPDGRLRRVTYTADAEHGFNAVVTYDGEAGPPAIDTGIGGIAPAAVAPVAPAAVIQAVRTSPAEVQAVRTVQAAPIATHHQIVQPFRTVAPAAHFVHPAAARVVHTNPTVATEQATHRLHTAVAPHIIQQQPTTTFIRNADGSLTPFNTNGGLHAIPFNSAFLRSFPNLFHA